MSTATTRVVVSHALAATALSLPWPLLVVLVHERTADPLLLGLAASARGLPYVAVSWATGRLADRHRRDTLVRLSLVLRLLMLVASAAAVAGGEVLLAVLTATAAVAIATPAYPAVVAALPELAGRRARGVTDLVVTIEVAAFTVGAALGGLLLHPSTRPLLPWVAVVLTVVALVVVAPVRMPAPRRRLGTAPAPAYAAVLASRPARRAIGVMAVLNFVVALLALALLPLAEGPWGSDAGGYGLATGVLGLAGLAGPVARRVARDPGTAVRRSLLLVAAGVVLLAPVTGVGSSLLPLALVGAAAVALESAGTSVLQEHLPDEVRATALGVNDTVIVAAAMVGSLLAPVAVDVLGGTTVLVALAVLTLLTAAVALPSQPRATVEPTAAVAQDAAEETDAPPPHRTAGAWAPPAAPAGAAEHLGVLRVPRQRRPPG